MLRLAVVLIRSLMMEKRRTYNRYEVSLPARCIGSAPQESCAGVIREISGNGMRISLQAPVALAAGRTVVLEIEVAGAGLSVQAAGNVRWCRPSGDPAYQWEAGLKMTLIRDRDLELLLQVAYRGIIQGEAEA